MIWSRQEANYVFLEQRTSHFFPVLIHIIREDDSSIMSSKYETHFECLCDKLILMNSERVKS